MPHSPFRTTLHESSDSALGNLQVIVETQSERDVGDGSFESVTRVLRSVEQVASWGGMAGDAYEPPGSRMTIAASRPMGAARHLWGFRCENVHPGVLLVIRNLIENIDGREVTIRSLEFRTSLPGMGGRMPATLPCDYEPREFPVEYGMTTSQVLVDVEFDGRYDPNAFDGFQSAWQAWETVSIAGGFADETYLPAKSTLRVEDDLLMTSTGMSCAFDGVAIADAGFYCLVNMLYTFNRRVARVGQVTIE